MIQITSSPKIKSASLDLSSTTKKIDALYRLIHNFDNVLPKTETMMINEHADIAKINNHLYDTASSSFLNSPYGWSDFPLVHQYQHSVINITTTSSSPLSSQTSSSSSSLPSAIDTHTSNGIPITTKKKHNKEKRCVSFSLKVEIRYHERIVGDHPYSSDALPLSLGWKYYEESQCLDSGIINENRL